MTEIRVIRAARNNPLTSVRSRNTLLRIGQYALLLMFSLFALAPIYWMLVTSFKPADRVFADSSLIPQVVTLDNWKKAFSDSGVLDWIRNSFVVATTTTAVSLVIGMSAAYAFARLRFPGRKTFATGLLASYLVPPFLLFIPLFSILSGWNLTNSLFGLSVVHLTITVPFATWLLLGYLQGLPKDYEEAAQIDGCSRIGAVIRIVVPLATPALAVTSMFIFTLSWNEFLYALIFLSDPGKVTISVGLVTLMASDVLPWGLLMACAAISSVVPAVMYFAAQRWVTSGLTIGGTKG